MAKVYATILPTGYVPGPLPAGKQVIGSSYEVRLSGGYTQLDKVGLVRLHYHPGVMGIYTNTAVYHWEPNSEVWQEVGGEPSEINNALSAPVDKLGIYALMGIFSDVIDDIYLPIILKQ